jgi:hypothetical protein
VTGYGVKGFVCKLQSVKRIDSVRALVCPLDSGLTFTVNHSSGAIGKLLPDVPYELIRDVEFEFISLSFMTSSHRSSELNYHSIMPSYTDKE